MMSFHKLLITTVLSCAALTLTACNGDDNGTGGATPTAGPGTPTVPTSTPTRGAGGLQWQQRGGGTSNQVPPSVTTVRIVFQSEGGESCCVAVDPLALGDLILVLDNLQPGPAVVSVAGFGTEFAPAVPGVTDTCETIPADVAEECDPVQVAPPAYESDPVPVTIVAGMQTNIGTVEVDAFPYALDVQPGQGETVFPTPAMPYPIVPFAFTVADGVTDIERQSVALDLMFNVEEPGGFRLVTKRVPLQLSACDDETTAPCSAEGTQELAGFKAAGVAEALPNGPVDVQISAQNTGDVPRDLDFRYAINVENDVVNVRAIGGSPPTSSAKVVPASASGGARILNLRAMGRSLGTASSEGAPASASHGAGNGVDTQRQSGHDAARARPRATTTPATASTDPSILRPAAVTPSPTATLTPAAPPAGGQ